METKQLFFDLKENQNFLFINKNKFNEFFKSLISQNDLSFIKKKIFEIKTLLNFGQNHKIFFIEPNQTGQTTQLSKQLLISDLEKIENAHTLERANYYLKHLYKAVNETKTNKINDINLNRWKEYKEILTDSLWIFDKRDSSGAHLAWYWGNFIPQIPKQLMLRFTKKNDWVLDAFCGSGTTLIECRKLGRNCIGFELNPEIISKAEQFIEKEPNKYKITTALYQADSTTADYKQFLSKHKINKVQLIILHPPYYDIIKFSDLKEDLSNAKNLQDFLDKMTKVAQKSFEILEKGRFLALVIGDKYENGQWIPLGFYTMQRFLQTGFLLKSIIVKNFEQTKAKRNQQELWRYRALVGNFYVFKHEYIFLFQKNKI